MNKRSLIRSTFFRHHKSSPFHTIIRIHLISLSSHMVVFATSFYLYGANVNVNAADLLTWCFDNVITFGGVITCNEWSFVTCGFHVLNIRVLQHLKCQNIVRVETCSLNQYAQCLTTVLSHTHRYITNSQLPSCMRIVESLTHCSSVESVRKRQNGQRRHSRRFVNDGRLHVFFRRRLSTSLSSLWIQQTCNRLYIVQRQESLGHWVTW